MSLRAKARKAVDAMPPGPQSWFAALSPETRAELLGVIEDYRDGKLPGLKCAAAVARWLKSELKLGVREAQIANFIRERANAQG